jgi:hypothetical protein
VPDDGHYGTWWFFDDDGHGPGVRRARLCRPLRCAELPGPPAQGQPTFKP